MPQANTWLDVTDLFQNSLARTNLVVGLSPGVSGDEFFNGDDVNFLANARVDAPAEERVAGAEQGVEVAAPTQGVLAVDVACEIIAYNTTETGLVMDTP